MPSFWQAELLKEGNLGLLSWGWVNRGLDRLAGRLSPVSCGFGWARPCYALFPLCSASPASHCALATADLGLAGRTSDQLPGNNLPPTDFTICCVSMWNPYIWINCITLFTRNNSFVFNIYLKEDVLGTWYAPSYDYCWVNYTSFQLQLRVILLTLVAVKAGLLDR